MSEIRYSPLLTDLYELTMMAGFFREGMHEKEAVFDLFFRKSPFQGSYTVFAGLETALKFLADLRFSATDIAYLKSLGIFHEDFLAYLKDFSFQGRVTAFAEGSAVFANEPLVTVEGRLAEVQLVETALLNIINFQTLAATKAARIKTIAGDREVLEFGLRRAHGPDGGLSLARAAYIGGVRSTSNVWSGQVFDIPVKGTHAHSWIMAFPDELSAFRAYADCFPDTCTLLIDTYHPLKSGLPNAITLAHELRAKGHELAGVRLDSGDLAYLSKKVRKALDDAGFPQVKIVASSELDEFVIQSIRNEGGQVDIYGVGTKLATCMGPGGGALGGVYKLVRLGGQPKLKVTGDIEKATLPDRKILYRVVNENGGFEQDVMCREGETIRPGDRVFDPTNPLRYKKIGPNTRLVHVREIVMDQGRICVDLPSLPRIADTCQGQLKNLPEGSLRLENPHRYKVSMSRGLYDLRAELLAEHEKQCP